MLPTMAGTLLGRTDGGGHDPSWLSSELISSALGAMSHPRLEIERVRVVVIVPQVHPREDDVVRFIICRRDKSPQRSIAWPRSDSRRSEMRWSSLPSR